MARFHNNPHDALFRILFEDPDRADRLIREHLPPELAALLDRDPLQPRKGTWIDPDLFGHQADILYEGRLRQGSPMAVYILLEHKSWDDRNLPLQILRYQTRIWEDYRKGNVLDARGKPSVGLPTVIPLVFYHGRRRWNHPLSVAGMLGKETPDILARFTPATECLLFDLGSYASAELSRDVVSWAVLSALTMSRSDEVSQDWLRGILAAVPDDHPLLIPLLRYIVLTMDLRMEDLERIGRDMRPRDWERAMGTIAEEWHREYGEGYRAEGRKEGRVELLLHQMTRRFGNLPPGARSRVLAATTHEIDVWADAVLHADSVDGVLTTSPGS